MYPVNQNNKLVLFDKSLVHVGDTDFSRSIFKDELTLFYQPQLLVQNNSISGIETLLRWYHPIFGLISPSIFLVDSPTTRISPSISKWIFDEAFFKFSDWHKQGLLSHLSINLSPEQFYGNELVKSIIKRLERHNLDSILIEIEVSESTLSQNIDMSQKILRDLRGTIGLKVTIDNFGQKYFSIDGLTIFPLDTVKICSSLLQKIDMDLGNRKLLESIVDLSKKLNMRCIAQGVESLEQFDFLKSIEIDSVQGNFICAPVSSEVMTKLLQTDSLTSKLLAYSV
ncbi:MAG TPA: EAL domain-containing protein [Stenomitos sp.]